ncbi:hypothetical protein PINS_up018364 [Pythium insidiosum]|nr:hypothetical protein PINS_up018364 [Pythium insidiosum]
MADPKALLQRLRDSSDEHTYTLCLVGYSQNLAHASSTTVRELPIQLDAAIAQVGCGLDWIALLTTAGRLYTFGNNAYGQLAQGHTQVAPFPKPIVFPIERRISRVSCGSSHGGFVLDSGALFMFGCGTYGRLGTGNEASQSTPVAIKMRWKDLQRCADELASRNGTTIVPGGRISSTAMSTSTSTATAARSNTADTKSSAEEVDDDEEVIFTDLSCGDRHTLALGARLVVVSGRNTSKQHIIAFGDGLNGRLGLGSEQDHPTGALVTQFKCSVASYVPSFASVSAGVAHNAALSSAGEIFTWGNGADGQLGHQSTDSEWVPREVQFFRGITMAGVKCGAKHTVAVSRTGVVYTWGRGLEGQLGTGATQSAAQPQRVGLSIDEATATQMQIEAQAAGSTATLLTLDTRVVVRSIVARENVSLALDEHARLFTWGDNSSGQLGISTGTGAAAAATASIDAEPATAPSVRYLLKPKQLFHMELRERKPAVARVQTLRDRMLMMAASLPRVALTHVDASDHFTLLVFRTQSSVSGHGSHPSASASDAASSSASSSAVSSRSFASMSAFLGQSLMNVSDSSSRNTMRNLLRQRSSLVSGLRLHGLPVQKWHLSLSEELKPSDIPSKEAMYYDYMANYKVHIRVPSPANGDDDMDDGESLAARIPRRASTLMMKDDGGSGKDDAASTAAGGGGGGAIDVEEAMWSFLDDDDGRHWISPGRPATESVRGYDAWLQRRSGQSQSASPLAKSPPRRPVQRVSNQNEKADDVVRGAEHTTARARARRLAAAASAARATSAATRPATVASPRPARSAFGRTLRPAMNDSSASSRDPPLTTAERQSLRQKASPARGQSSAPRVVLAPFGSSVASRFGPTPSPVMTNESPIDPAKAAQYVLPRSPTHGISGNAEHFSAVISRRLRTARGSSPGPGTYERHGG